ncbi:MAG TPA: hypothetical protein VEM76_16265 [Anaeromyxobacteraceae bacterium]|nr:hypothetical protein [Anaeromyxobacteraceae bacterium]
MADVISSMDPQEIAQAVSAVKDQVVRVVQQAGEQLEVERRMHENPWMVLGIAAGAGFLLGGGLWPALRPIVKATARAALSPANLVAIAAAFGAMKAAQGGGEDAGGDGAEAAPTSH